MTLQQLAYFVSACRLSNISKAAEEFHVSQPSVSSAIKNLEKEFGVCLIRRRSTGFVLTEEGEVLLPLAESLVRHGESVAKVMRAKGRQRRLIRLGVPPMVASALFPSLYTAFVGEHPEVEILTQEMGREDLLLSLEEGRLDMALLPHNEDFPPLYRAIPVMEFETVCCVNRSHPFAAKASVSARDLAGEPLVLFSKGFFHTERIFSLFAEAGVEPQVMHTSSQLSTVERFISSGVAVGFLFRELAEQNENLIPISLEPKCKTQISLVFHRDLLMTDAMNVFVRFVQEKKGS